MRIWNTTWQQQPDLNICVCTDPTEWGGMGGLFAATLAALFLNQRLWVSHSVNNCACTSCEPADRLMKQLLLLLRPVCQPPRSLCYHVTLHTSHLTCITRHTHKLECSSHLTIWGAKGGKSGAASRPPNNGTVLFNV